MERGGVAQVNPMLNFPDANAPLRVLCFGVGAIGTYIGGSLAGAGNEVVFFDRPEVGDLIHAGGLRLQLQDGERVVAHPQTVRSISEVQAQAPYHLAIIAVKAFDTAPLLEALPEDVSWLPPVLCLQNGVENEGLITNRLGVERVVAASVTTAIGRRGAGQIVVERLRGIGVAGSQAFLPELIARMNQAGLEARRYANPQAMKWSKMLTNLLANASSAILDLPPAVIFKHPGLYRMELRMLTEALAVMQALHIPVIDLPGTPVRLLVGIARNLPAWLSQPLLENSLGKGRGAKMPSFHIDLHSGRGKSEVDFLNGAVVRFGEKTSVPTPVNRWLNTTLLAMADGQMPKDLYANDPEKFLAAINQ